MTERKRLALRRNGRAIVFTLPALLVGGEMLQWSWNVFAAGLLEAPAMQFRHVLVAQLLLAVVFAVAGAASGLRGRLPAGGAETSTRRSPWAQTIHNPEE